MPTTQELTELLNRAFSLKEVTPSDFPEIDLYIDQILTIFEDKLEDNRRDDKEKLLTKAMVNNYSKEKLLTPIRGKTYPRQQILELLAIFRLKNSLPMADIRRVLDKLRSEEDSKAVLTRLLDTNTLPPTELPNQLLPTDSEEFSQEDIMRLLLEMNRMSCIYRRACEAIVDQYFPAPPNRK